MHKLEQTDLLYDHMPKPDSKLPPFREVPNSRHDGRRLIGEKKDSDVSDLLASLNFG